MNANMGIILTIGSVLTGNARKVGEVRMTLQEFSDKYHVPYHIVYEASYKVPAISTDIRDRDFPEDQLFNETDRIIQERVDRHARLMIKANRIFINLHSVRAKEGMPCELPQMRRENTDD